MNSFDTLVILDTTTFVLNILCIYLFFKFHKFYFINFVILINAFRLFYSYLVFDNSWWLKHSIWVLALLLVNFLDTKKLTKFFNSRDYYLRILMAFFFLVFTFKENFMILHPGIGGWTYEYSSNFIINNTYENVENSNANLNLKNQIIEMTPKVDINGFADGYMHSYQIPVAKTSIGDVIFNGGDFHFVFPQVIFNRIKDEQELLNVQINILEKTLCHRIDGNRFLINRNISYPNHTPFFKLNSLNADCNDDFEVYDIQFYRVYSNIVKENFEVKKVEIQK
tara:strand:+ start:755 stop:1597 length:843 start_codon:yes stop_codon:yes gene_type:complete